MRPADNTRVWRKQQRAAEKGVPTGRRASHKVETQKPERPFEAWRNRRAGLPLWPTNATDGA